MNNPEATTRPTPRRWWIMVAAIAVALIAVAGSAAYAFGTHHHSPAVADATMAARAQQVMPFDLNRTTHTFTQTAVGGVEKVVANDPTDARDIALIRSHLQTEAEHFRHGNYSDPAEIHGMNMPGVSDLQQGAARVDVVFAELADGAQVTYTAKAPGLVAAIHAWFDRQAGDHSTPGMGG